MDYQAVLESLGDWFVKRTMDVTLPCTPLATRTLLRTTLRTDQIVGGSMWL